MSNTTLCAKCRGLYEEERWIVIGDLHLHVCPECMLEMKYQLIKSLQEKK